MIGKATLAKVEVEIPFEGKPVGQDELFMGAISTYIAKTSDLSQVQFGVVTWPNGDAEVIPIDVSQDGELKYERLKNAGRMTLINIDDRWLGELNAMKFNQETQRANLASATLGDLDHFAETSFKVVLEMFGKVTVGTREILHGETSRNRNKLAFICSKGNKDLVAAAYVVTRVLAILKDYGV